MDDLELFGQKDLVKELCQLSCGYGSRLFKGGGGGGTTTTTATLPPQLRKLYKETSGRMLGLQRAYPLDSFFDPFKVGIEDITKSPGFYESKRAFESQIIPRIENTLALQGLNRSQALPNALAQAESEYMLPVVQDELSRQLQDNLRRQALREQILLSPFSQLPSTIGQQTQTRTSQSGGGLFK